MIYHKSSNIAFHTCVEELKNGGIVIIPTDTVYGFSGLVDSAFECDKKIRKIKGRSVEKSFIRLIEKPEDIFLYTNDKIPDALLSLWPAPLTIVVNDKLGGTCAYRCPDDKWLRELIASCASPLYSTSVNRSGFPILSKIDDIIREFESEVSLIVDAGDIENLKPSTIVSITDGIKVLRQGDVVLKEVL